MQKPSRRHHNRNTEDDDVQREPEERFDKAFLIAIGVFAIFFPVVFVPVVGLVIVLTLGPYLAGYQSGKYINKKDGILIAVIAGVIWSLVEIWILFSILGSLDLAVAKPGIYTGLDWIIVIFLIFMNVLFCSIGSLFTPRVVRIDTD
jgi:hypothetical protein